VGMLSKLLGSSLCFLTRSCDTDSLAEIHRSSFDHASRVHVALHSSSSGYLLDVSVGLPPQRASLAVRTTDSVSHIPCSRCESCVPLPSPFNLSKSSTARRLPCNSGCGSACRNEPCIDGTSSVRGNFFRDVVRLSTGSAFACTLDCRQGLAQHISQGGLALGPQGVLDLFGSIRPHSAAFALRLCEQTGELTIGGWSHGQVRWLPMQVTDRYHFEVEAVGFGGARYPVLQRAVVDSGVVDSLLPSSVHQQIVDGLDLYCNGRGRCGGARRHGACWALSDPLDVASFPLFYLQVSGGSDLPWTPSSYLRSGDGLLWCFSFNRNPEGTGDIVLGTSWMLGHEIVFDLQDKRLGIAPAVCSGSASRRVQVTENVTAQHQDDDDEEDGFLSGVTPEVVFAAVSMFCLPFILACIGCYGRRLWVHFKARTSERRHVQLAEIDADENGMPPAIIGMPGEAGCADTFMINGEDDDDDFSLENIGIDQLHGRAV